MNFQVSCENCGKVLIVKVEHQGQRGRCPRCRHTQLINRPQEVLEQEIASILGTPEEDSDSKSNTSDTFRPPWLDQGATPAEESLTTNTTYKETPVYDPPKSATSASPALQSGAYWVFGAAGVLILIVVIAVSSRSKETHPRQDVTGNPNVTHSREFNSGPGSFVPDKPVETEKEKTVREFREFAVTKVALFKATCARIGEFKYHGYRHRLEIRDNYEIDVTKSDSLLVSYKGTIEIGVRMRTIGFYGEGLDLYGKWVELKIPCVLQDGKWKSQKAFEEVFPIKRDP